MKRDEKKSPFYSFLETLAGKRVYFEKMGGNNGDKLITMGVEYLLQKCESRRIEVPEEAEYFLINGGNTNDTWRARVDKLAYYRRRYPAKPLIVAPSSFRFKGIDFRQICLINNSPFILFARERYSADILRKMDLPSCVRVEVSQDLAFELRETDFISDLREKTAEKHILIAMRRDKEGPVGILMRTHVSWLPKCIRKPLSKMRDRLTAYISKDVIKEVIRREGIAQDLPRVYRDVAEALSFEEFVDVICNSERIITDRLHVAILGFLLSKKVILIPREDHKIKGVYEMSMSGMNSRTILWKRVR